MFRIAIIIPVFNGLEFTVACLQSLFQGCEIESLRSKIKVVLVDDASQDGTFDWVRRNYPQVVVLKGTGDLWWSGGINRGVKYSLDRLNSDYIVWWNNDIHPDKNYFKNLEHVLQRNIKDNVIGSKVFMDAERIIIWSMGGLFNPKTGRKFMLGSGEADSDNYSIETEVDWLPGMGTITHRSVYEKIGFLDERRFPQYHGDSDFTLRAKNAGWNVIVYPELILYNDTTNSGIRHNDRLKRFFTSMISLKSNYNIKKDLLFYKKHSKSIFAYTTLIEKYFRYIGGFVKWKLLALFGTNRT